MNKQPVIIKTFLHLKDKKGWEKTEEFPGEYPDHNRYFIQQYARYRDATVPITKFQQPDYPSLESIQRSRCEFEVVNAKWEKVYDHYHFKHLYMEEV